MSGAEALAGIGILCNVMQIVTFGKDALEVYRYVRDNGTSDAKLGAYLADATTSYQEMRSQLSETAALTSDQKEVVNIGEGAHKALEKLRIYFKELFVDERSRKGFRGKFRVAKSGIKTLLRGKELEDLEKDFQRYQQLLQTRLVHRVCNQSDAIALLTQESFTRLNATQQSMVQGIAQGQTELSLLVSQNAIEMKNHITDQHKETRTTLGHYLSITENNLHSHISKSTSVVHEDLAYRSKTADGLKRHDQILASLRYPEMNGRKNHVVTSFPETFQWIFSNEGPWEDTSSSSDEQSLPSDDESSASGDEQSVSGETSSHKEHSDNEEPNEHSDADKDEDEPVASDASDSDSTTLTASSVPEPTTFSRWLGSDSHMFWISGKPASGKSTLMKFIATSSNTKEKIADWRSNVNILSHYFWKAGSVMERSLKGCLLSLTHQVLLDRVGLSQRMWEDIPDVRHKWSPADWDLQQLETALLWVLEATEEPFLLLIDGLDESEEFEKHLSIVPRRPNILDRLAKLKDVKICVSSREEHTFLTYFEGVERLQLHELTKYDIRKFADARLEGLTFAQPEDREKLLDLIVSRASGVFLWVALVLDSVTRAVRIDNSIESLMERVDHMPRDLVDLVREMWERSGEDGEVRSYRATASRYFNLAEKGRVGDHDLWTSSILFLAIASDKQGVESMLDLDRVWDIEEMEMLCSKTEKEVRIACHGLLEVKVESSSKSVLIPKRIDAYRTMQVWFTHRCVIDFLCDTESGKALLGACGWSSEEVSARLEAARVIFLSRLMLTDNSGFRHFADTLVDETVDGKRHILRMPIDNCVETVLRNLSRFEIESPYRRFLFDKCIEWHFAGIPFDRAGWAFPGRSVFAHDPLRNEFLASAAKAASLSFMEKLIENLSTEDFLSALPAIFRGLSIGYCQDESESGSPEDRLCVLKMITLTERILTRLLSLDEGKTKPIPPKAVTGETREELQRLVCSWFLSIWVGLQCDYLKEESKTSLLAVLHLITLSLPAIEDWDQSILLFLSEESDKTWSPRGFISFMRQELGPECFLVANLATAFQIILDSNRPKATELLAEGNPVKEAQVPRLPEGANPSLRVVVSKRVKPKRGWELYIWSEYGKEDEDKVSASLLHLLLTGSRITEEMVNVEGQERRKVARTGAEVFRYLITKIGDTPGLPMHPWSSWLIGNVSENEESESPDSHVDGRSQELLIELLRRTSQA